MSDDADPTTSAADGTRVIRLLWDPPDPTPTRGPRPKTNLTDVVTAAVAVADADGLASVSMRKVAQHLGIGAMSLYTYVPGRAELIELMIDRVYGETAPAARPSEWLVRLERWVRSTWELFGRHPWLLEYNDARLPIGPHVLDNSEELYATLLDAGFTGAGTVAVANLIRWQLLGAARSTIGDADESRRTGVTSEDYWDSRDSFWTTYFDYARFPAMAAVHEAGGFDDPAGWDFESLLTRLLAGIALLPRESGRAQDNAVSR